MTQQILKKMFTIAFFLQIFVNIAQSDTHNFGWMKLYNCTSPGQNVSLQILVDPSGNVYSVGYTECPDAGTDIVIIKYNPNGQQLWATRSGLGGDDYPRCALLVNGYIYVTGWNMLPQGNKRVVTIKCDLSGNITNMLYYDRAAGDYGNSIAVDNSGNMYVVGRTDTLGNQKYLVIKYSSSGTKLWDYTYVGNQSGTFDEALSVKIDQNSNVFVSGYTSQLNINYDYLTMKFNSTGTLQWVKRYNGPVNKDDKPIGLVLDANSNVYVTGYSFSNNTTQSYLTIKYNTNGDSVAAAFFNCANNTINQPTAITIDNSNNIYVTGFGQGNTSNSYYDYVTIKYNSALSQQWMTKFVGSGNSLAHSIIYINSHVYVAGESYYVNRGKDFLTMEYDANSGTALWGRFENYVGEDSDYAYSVVTDQSENIYVTGYTSATTNSYIMTVKYSQNPNLVPEPGLAHSFIIYQNYPNPFNPITKIKIEINQTSFVKLSVYDISGKEVNNLVNTELFPGLYTYEFDGSEFSSGIYFYTIETNKDKITKKMILIK